MINNLVRKERTRNNLKILILFILVISFSLFYILFNSYLDDLDLFLYVLKIRLPTLVVILIAAFSIGVASLIFQTIINNRIVTPCILGMNSMYTLTHTAVVFIFGSASIVVTNQNIAFGLDVVLMGIIATIIYGFIFKKTKYNILYVLLIGTVLSSFLGSIQSSLIRIMDPNEYDSLLTTLVADFNNVNSEIIIFSLVLIFLLFLFLRKELKLLNVIGLGKDQSINLGIDYDKVIKKLLLGVVLLISIATALVGPISFLGLIIANLARSLFKTYKHSYLTIGSILIGMVTILLGQIISQYIFNFEIPVSTFITIGGGIYFLYLLVFKRGGYWWK